MKCPSTALACSLMKASCQSVKTPAFVTALDLVVVVTDIIFVRSYSYNKPYCPPEFNQGFFITKKYQRRVFGFHKPSTHEGICV